MATYKVRHEPKIYQTQEDVERAIQYIISPTKAKGDGIFGGAVLLENAADAMNCITSLYHNESGPRLRHSVLSFSPDEMTPEQAKEIAPKCIEYYIDQYQILASVHEDREHIHIHIAMNTTSYTDGSKYLGKKSDYYRFLNHLNQVTRPYGIKVKVVK